MKLIPVNPLDGAHVRLLYSLLAERSPESFVSHERMPTIEEHEQFVRSAPFLWWHIVSIGTVGAGVGAIECTDRNEVGVTISRAWQRSGIGAKALRMFMEAHQPLPAIRAIRSGRWLANVAPSNVASQAFFTKMGFVPVQTTYRHG